MPLVLDASVTLSWCFADEQTDYSLRIGRRLSTDVAVVPAVWLLEVANALLLAERRGRLGTSDLANARGLLLHLSVRFDDAGVEVLGDVLEIARSRTLSAYDAAYLELAMREGLALATLDERLSRAAAALGVPIAD